MKRSFYTISTLAALLLSACSNPLDKEFNRETAEADFTRLVKLGKLDSSDASIMAHFMVEHDLIGAQVLEIGATYRDILAESKNFWQKARAPQPHESSVLASQQIEINIKPDTKKIEQSPWSTSLPYLLTIHNTSGKDIQAFKGRFVFIDPFGEPLHEVEYKYLNPIGINQRVDQPISFRITHILSPNKIVQYNKTNPFKVEWKADSVITQ